MKTFCQARFAFHVLFKGNFWFLEIPQILIDDR